MIYGKEVEGKDGLERDRVLAYDTIWIQLRVWHVQVCWARGWVWCEDTATTDKEVNKESKHSKSNFDTTQFGQYIHHKQ